MIRKSNSDIMSQDICKDAQQAFAGLFRLLLEDNLALRQEPSELYKHKEEKTNEHSRA
jgi:hypothetical protein